MSENDPITHNSRRRLGALMLFYVTSLLKLIGRIVQTLFVLSAVLIIVVFSIYYIEYETQVRSQFEGQRWTLPSRVFARPLPLFVGKPLYANFLEKELQLLNYQASDDSVLTVGEYRRQGGEFYIWVRGFQFAEDHETSRVIGLTIENEAIKQLYNVHTSVNIERMRLDPVLIGNFYPQHGEDRILLRTEDVPRLFVQSLLEIEDKAFFEHGGLNPMAILRAFLANMKAGTTVQGGSTITQQVVKNLFLSNEQTLSRKIKEAMMAFILEVRYSKKDILEAYLNEVYLGQDGDRSIHGFGLAAQFYFGQTLAQLRIEQQALLIALVKGASFYDPRRYPDLALQRRNLVLLKIFEGGYMNQEQYQRAKSSPLGVLTERPKGISPFPAYLDVVKNELQRDYPEQWQNESGLLVLTAMNPLTQINAEMALGKRLKKVDKRYRHKKSRLNGAVVISQTYGNKLVAVIGDRDVRYAGYNRALHAKRQIGSLVKPFIYLLALNQHKKYTLATSLDDGPVTVKLGKRKYWRPRNYDRHHKGDMILFNALIHSRNTPAVRMGVKLGVEQVARLLNNAGAQEPVMPYPSILLGALELTPLEVQQMYSVLALDGTYIQQSAINKVLTSKGKTILPKRNDAQQISGPNSTALLQYAMHNVTVRGTGAHLSRMLPRWKKVAGKTGTTNDTKDSWFSGFSGEHVVTVWLGRDDSKATGLTGGTGALLIWGDIMKSLPSIPLSFNRKAFDWLTVDTQSGQRYNARCGRGVHLPFIKGTSPRKQHYCPPPPPPPIIWTTPQNTETPAPKQQHPMRRASTPRPLPKQGSGQPFDFLMR